MTFVKWRWQAKKKLSAIPCCCYISTCISCLPVCEPAENGLGVQGELSRNLVQVVRLVKSDNLQFFLSRVALPSKLFARATWGPAKGGLQSFCHDPIWSTQRELLLTSQSVIFTSLLAAASARRSICSNNNNNKFSLLLIIRVNEIHCPMCLTNKV